MKWLECGDFLVWYQSEGTALEHALREASEHRAHLSVEVAQHFIGAPAADEADDVSIDAGAEEGIGA